MLTKYSLQKQLVIIFSIIAIGVLAILLPIIDNNLTHVIDNEMYDVLTRSQNDFYSYDFSPDYAGSDKQIYHFTYNINEDTLTTAQNISAKKYQILDYVFQNDLYKMVKKNKKKLQEKVKMQDQTVYYQIVKADDSNYIISLVYSDYSKTLINNLKDQVIDIFYIAFLIIGLALFIWVSSLIKPLKLIKNYIDDIKNDKESEMHIQREDEIGVLSSSLIQMKEEIDRQNEIKEEMIHNISHDLKTPLTSIISYIDLLKNEDLSKEQQDEYIDILDRNTKRLKTLIEDLFEVSKVNSGNIQLNPIDLDIHALLQQVLFEYQEQFEHHHLNLKNDYENKKIICHLDSEKTYRVLENLCQNICKYALEHTRVYLQIIETNQQVIVVFKNISAHEISNPGDLTERFVQGDASRKSEGSGLGLAICKSFVEVQGGTFEVNVDGDLFKTTIIFPKKIEND